MASTAGNAPGSSPFLGVRETHRFVGRYVLKEQDLTAGLAHQEHEDIVALADHSIDFHGARPSREVPNSPYGIPFRCLLPRELDNLLVACRGASFSSIGATSCRLSRTRWSWARPPVPPAALCGGERSTLDTAALRHTLQSAGVTLDLPSGYLDAMADITPLSDRDFAPGQPYETDA